MISTNQFKSGIFIKLDGQLYMIMEFQHHKPGKGGAVVRTKLRNVKAGSIVNRTFRAGDAVENVFVEEKKFQYLYADNGHYHFMDSESYEQISISEKVVGSAKNFLKENSEVSVTMYESDILDIKLPTFIDLKVAEAGPGSRGDTVKQGTKNAMLETGATVQVPLFINSGDIIKIDTRTGGYVGRA
ncbi:MAG: elongation factor P [Candidatus Omnitrophica bacterium]|nr:elongation factor P [Candidatus Omnitrophota bacterium]